VFVVGAWQIVMPFSPSLVTRGGRSLVGALAIPALDQGAALFTAAKFL